MIRRRYLPLYWSANDGDGRGQRHAPLGRDRQDPEQRVLLGGPGLRARITPPPIAIAKRIVTPADDQISAHGHEEPAERIATPPTSHIMWLSRQGTRLGGQRRTARPPSPRASSGAGCAFALRVGRLVAPVLSLSRHRPASRTRLRLHLQPDSLLISVIIGSIRPKTTVKMPQSTTQDRQDGHHGAGERGLAAGAGLEHLAGHVQDLGDRPVVLGPPQEPAAGRSATAGRAAIASARVRPCSTSAAIDPAGPIQVAVLDALAGQPQGLGQRQIRSPGAGRAGGRTRPTRCTARRPPPPGSCAARLRRTGGLQERAGRRATGRRRTAADGRHEGRPERPEGMREHEHGDRHLGQRHAEVRKIVLEHAPRRPALTNRKSDSGDEDRQDRVSQAEPELAGQLRADAHVAREPAQHVAQPARADAAEDQAAKVRRDAVVLLRPWPESSDSPRSSDSASSTSELRNRPWGSSSARREQPGPERHDPPSTRPAICSVSRADSSAVSRLPIHSL